MRNKLERISVCGDGIVDCTTALQCSGSKCDSVTLPIAVLRARSTCAFASVATGRAMSFLAVAAVLSTDGQILPAAIAPRIFTY